jgi:predicted DNA-binding transcriptional regulator YafY
LTKWEIITTKLSPYRVLFSHRSWYIIGRSSLHRSTRTFNLSRIKELEPLDDGYKIPRGFSVSRYLRNAWHLIPSGPDRKVVIRFEKMVAQNVNEVNWHKTQETKWNDDGSLEFRVTVSGLSEISWWIIGYGDQAKVLAPRELRNMIVQRAERTVERYRGKG